MMYYIYMIIQIKYVFMHILHYTRCMCVLSCMAEASVGLGETEYLQEVKRLVLNMAKKNVSISFGWICVCVICLWWVHAWMYIDMPSRWEWTIFVGYLSIFDQFLLLNINIVLIHNIYIYISIYIYIYVYLIHSRYIYMSEGYLRFARVKKVPFLCPSCSCLARPDMIRTAVPGA